MPHFASEMDEFETAALAAIPGQIPEDLSYDGNPSRLSNGTEHINYAALKGVA